MASREVLIAAIGELAIEQEAEPVGMADCGGFAGYFEFGKDLRPFPKPELAQLLRQVLLSRCQNRNSSSASRPAASAVEDVLGSIFDPPDPTIE
jgi:hypothetical protein